MLRFPYLTVEVSAGQEEMVTDQLWSHGATGIEQRDAETLLTPAEGPMVYIAHFEDEEAAKQAQDSLSAHYKVNLNYIIGDAWRDEWKKFFHAQRLGRLLVHPSWEPVTPQAGEVTLVIDPGRAFGSGTHASTRLLLLALEKYVRPGQAVLDVGCGSGILSVAALLLGATKAIGVDIDEPSLEVAVQNAQENGVERDFRVSSEPLHQLEPATYDIVVANIEAPVHLTLVNELISRVAVDGLLMLSGLLLDDEARIRDAFQSLAVVERCVEGEWIALIFKRETKNH